MDDILNEADAEDEYHNLHKHRKCCNHTPILIAAKEYKIAEEHFGYKKNVRVCHVIKTFSFLAQS